MEDVHASSLRHDESGSAKQVRATTDAQKTLLATSYSNLDKISQARTVRILTARDDTDHRGRSGRSSC